LTAFADKLEIFWDYFEKQWMTKVDPTCWNVSEIVGKTDANSKALLVNRTDNPLERHNRDMKVDFSSAHPSLMDFVYAIRRKSNDFVSDIEAIRLHHKEQPLRKDMSDRHKDALKSLFKILPEFYTFIMPPKPAYVPKK